MEKELRIGNIIYTTRNAKESEPYEFIVTASSMQSIEMFPEAYNPIPLMEEWAVKFGKTRMGLKVQANSYPDGDLYIDNEGEGYYLFNCNDGYRFGKEIKYVHTLQNLYYALTQTELTINN
jgi:hypothetical protein